MGLLDKLLGRERAPVEPEPVSPLALLAAGKVREFNTWRTQNPDTPIDFNGWKPLGYLRDANLDGCDLTGVIDLQNAGGLGNASLKGTRLSKAQVLELLRIPDVSHYERNAFNRYRADNPNVIPELTGFNASGVKFSNRQLNGLDLTGVLNLELSTDLSSANLHGAKVSDAQLIALLNKGQFDAFNQYRKHNPTITPNLTGWDMPEGTPEKLAYVNFSGCDFTGVSRFNPAILGASRLDGAKYSPQQLETLWALNDAKLLCNYLHDNPEAAFEFNGRDASGKNLVASHYPRNECFKGRDLSGLHNIENAKAIGLAGAIVSDAQLKGWLDGSSDKTFNQYRSENPQYVPDFAGWDAGQKNLGGVDLKSMDLRKVHNIHLARGLDKAQLDSAMLDTKQMEEIKSTYQGLNLQAKGVVLQAHQPTQRETFQAIAERRGEKLTRPALRRGMPAVAEPASKRPAWRDQAASQSPSGHGRGE